MRKPKGNKHWEYCTQGARCEERVAAAHERWDRSESKDEIALQLNRVVETFEEAMRLSAGSDHLVMYTEEGRPFAEEEQEHVLARKHWRRFSPSGAA